MRAWCAVTRHIGRLDTEQYSCTIELLEAEGSLGGRRAAEKGTCRSSTRTTVEAEDLLELPLLAQCGYIMRIYDGDVAAAKLAIEEALS